MSCAQINGTQVTARLGMAISRVVPEKIWAQLFEGRLAFKRGLNLTRVFFSSVHRHLLG